MGRDPRFVPENSLQHVVDIVFQNRRLLCPSEEVNELFLGVLGRAQRLYAMKICAVVVLSTHVHLLLRPRDGAHLAAFMCYLKTQVSKEIGALRGWKGAFFDGRYHATTVSDEDLAQVAVLRYVLSHGPKECLVDTVYDWPGVHSAKALVEGVPLIGRRRDRKAERTALDAGEDPPEMSEEEVVLSPLPCWEHLPEETRRRAVAELVEEINRDAAVQRAESGKTSLGPERVRAVDPRQRPESVERSPKPRVHAVAPKVLNSFLEALKEVFRAFYEASAELRAGNRNAVFPEGTFPPRLPFVPFGAVGLHGARGRPA